MMNCGVLGRFTKQPNEAIDYDVDYTDWFANRADAPLSHAVSADPGITVDGHSRSGAVVKVVLSGGTVNESYKVTVRMTTDAALPVTKEADFVVTIKEI